MRIAWVAMFLAAACDNGGHSVPVDAAPDAPVIPVVELSSCPAFVAATIMDSPTMFIPKDSPIPAGEVAKFVITGEHFVLPNSLVMTDDILRVSRGQTKCFKFNVPGTYGFLCGAHGFTGTVTVQ